MKVVYSGGHMMFPYIQLRFIRPDITISFPQDMANQNPGFSEELNKFRDFPT